MYPYKTFTYIIPFADEYKNVLQIWKMVWWFLKELRVMNTTNLYT